MTITRAVEESPEIATGYRRGRGLVALFLGFVGLTVGVGAGLRWLLAEVWTLKTIAAAGAAGRGIALTMWGLLRLTGGMRPAFRIVVGSISVLAVALLVWTFVPALMATNPPPTDRLLALTVLDGREVWFETQDGVRLWGWFVTPLEGKTVSFDTEQARPHPMFYLMQ